MAKRPFEHKLAQQLGKMRDEGKCQICGSNDCPEGHHIIDYSYSGSPDENNIITLCHKHHKDVHAGKINIIKF